MGEGGREGWGWVWGGGRCVCVVGQVVKCPVVGWGGKWGVWKWGQGVCSGQEGE